MFIFRPLPFLWSVNWKTGFQNVSQSTLRFAEFICIHKAVVDKVEFKSAHCQTFPQKPHSNHETDNRFVLLIWHVFVIACVKLCPTVTKLYSWLCCRVPKRSSWLRSCQTWSSTARVSISATSSIQEITRLSMKWPPSKKAKQWTWQKTQVKTRVLPASKLAYKNMS